MFVDQGNASPSGSGQGSQPAGEQREGARNSSLTLFMVMNSTGLARRRRRKSRLGGRGRMGGRGQNGKKMLSTKEKKNGGQ